MHRSAHRIAAISLSSLRVELARQSEPALVGKPLAIVVARPGGAVVDEASVLGNTHLDEVSLEAKSLGIYPAMTIAAARARAAELNVRVLAERAAALALARVAELALAFGATVGFDAATHVVWADVTGCAHLHSAGDLRAGEELLAKKLSEKVTQLGHDACVAVADGPRVAAIFAKMLACSKRPGLLAKATEARCLVVPPEATQQALAELPLSAFPIDEAAKHWLARLGMKTAADLGRLPRGSLAQRLGPQARALFSLFDGADTSPLDPYRPPETPVERLELEYGIEGGEAVLFALRTLAARLAARLEGRALGTTELTLTFELDDAARSSEKRRRSRHERVLVLASPVRSEHDIFAVARARVEAAERRQETFTAPILAVELAATKLARLGSRNLDLLVSEGRAASIIPRLAAELSADLGEGKAGMLSLVSSLDPAERARLVPFEERARTMLVSVDVPEPSRLFVEPAPVTIHVDGGFRLIARTAWLSWWKRPVELLERRTTERDLGVAWSSEAKATAWLEQDGTTGSYILRGWE